MAGHEVEIKRWGPGKYAVPNGHFRVIRGWNIGREVLVFRCRAHGTESKDFPGRRQRKLVVFCRANVYSRLI